jgi:radical SAM/Cys-rich protein
MNWNTMVNVMELAHQIRPNLVDITGGAPEYNPHLIRFIEKLSPEEYQVQVRTNLTVLLEPWASRYIGYYQKHGVKLLASLPCYEASKVDSVRGEGTFERSIKVLRMLNETGYGKKEGLTLDLVFNPEDSFLPPSQAMTEDVFREKLYKGHGIVFNSLITLTNMPIGRFLESLKENGEYEKYFELLKNSYNPITLERLMCRSQISVDWEGSLFDCDFNLALGLPIEFEYNLNNHVFDVSKLKKRRIKTGNHCFGCAAGQGSSCSGALV